jgi:hypothetical protein
VSVATVRPNETIAPDEPDVTGAANAHTALSDDSDSSYLTPASAETHLGFAEPTIPGTATLKEVRVRTRSAKTGSPTFTYRVSSDPGEEAVAQQAVTWLSPTTTTVAIFKANAFNPGEVTLRIKQINGSGRLYEVYLDFVYVEGPVVTITAPTGTITTTNLPTVEWDSTLDEAADSQTHFEVKVFTDAIVSDPGFDPDTSTPVASSGIVASRATSYRIDGLDADDNPLPNGDYVVFVRIAQRP